MPKTSVCLILNYLKSQNNQRGLNLGIHHTTIGALETRAKPFHCRTVLQFFLRHDISFLSQKTKTKKRHEAKSIEDDLGNTHKPGKVKCSFKREKTNSTSWRLSCTENME